MAIGRFDLLKRSAVTVYPKSSLRSSLQRLSFCVRALLLEPELRYWLASSEESSLRQTLLDRPETLGVIVWPYLSITWQPRRRLAQIRKHYEYVDKVEAGLNFPIQKGILLLDLSDRIDFLRVIVDRPRWFMREGELALNLFQGDIRIYTIAFTLEQTDSGTIAYVGAIQGRNISNIMETYKLLTKELHGMRPRDFVIELFRMFCGRIGVKSILAVNDANRHHRSSYFGPKTEKFDVNYNDVWRDRGGVPHDEAFFRLSITGTRRSLDDVAAKKRSMYRKRYEMLDDIENRVLESCSNLSGRLIEDIPPG